MQILITSLSFTYRPGSPMVLDDIDLDVPSGSVHALVGPNGCGKTTLLRIVAGLAKPTSGVVEFIGERRHDNLRAVVFQEPRLLPHWTIQRNIAIGPEFGSRPTSLYQKIRAFHTKQVGLDGVGDRKPHEVSLGQQTMAGVGRGMAHDSDILLLDEPFAHIDAIRRKHMREEFETYWQMDPRTVLLVTHDVEEAVLVADRVSVMPACAGPLVATIQVDLPRPRSSTHIDHPGFLSATSRLWDALEST